MLTRLRWSRPVAFGLGAFGLCSAAAAGPASATGALVPGGPMIRAACAFSFRLVTDAANVSPGCDGTLVRPSGRAEVTMLLGGPRADTPSYTPWRT